MCLWTLSLRTMYGMLQYQLVCSFITCMTLLQGISVGKYHAGVLTNSDEAEAAVLKAGKISGDLNFPLPYSPELHFSEFNSVVADMKNSVAVRGKFIHHN